MNVTGVHHLTLTVRDGDGWTRVRRQWPNGLVIGVTRHDTTGAAEVMDREGITRGPVETAPYGWAVTGRDPDGIPVEFFCSRS